MNPSDQNPKLPNWLFIVTDLALIATAAVIAYRSATPLSSTAIISIVACVGLGAIVGLVPLIMRVERVKNEALNERQQALEALAQTVNSSAEQISIAAAGLHTITELTHKNLRQAEQLPHKLQEKIAEFQSQLGVATDAEREELERELLSLRTTESERLESVSQRIAKSSAEWAKLEQATQQHLAAATEALAKLSMGTASAIGKAQVAAEQALTHARIEAARNIGEASGQAARTIDSARQAGLAEMESKLNAATASIVDRIVRELGATLATAPKLASTPSASAGRAAPTEAIPANHSGDLTSATQSTVGLARPTERTESIAATPPGPVQNPGSEASAEPPVPTPKRARKPRKEEMVAPIASMPPPAPAPAEALDDLSSPKSAEPLTSTSSSVPDFVEPPPVMADRIPEIVPVAPLTVHPFAGHVINGAGPTPPPTESAPPVDSPKPPRRRPTPKTDDADLQPGLGLDLDDTSDPSGGGERVISSDGATRLLVTSYIGIGNRLFIRGEGPGLSWEKGVPLQFVSIGKWRWESSDASAPVQFKLYKNDEVECATLGTQSVDAGYQQELTAGF